MRSRTAIARLYRLILGIGLSSLLIPTAVNAQVLTTPPSDSLTTESHGLMTEAERVRTPKGALRRAALAPGWGQIYNRQYLKLPLVYGGIGLFLASAIRTNSDYQLYHDAYQYKAYQELVDSGQLEENPRASGQSAYDGLAAVLGPVSSSPLRTRRDNLRRNRDLSYLGIGVIWGLALIDAYVSAHLADFDVGEDLSIQWRPSIVPQNGTLSPSVRISLDFR